MKTKDIPFRNQSPSGWYIGSYIERFEFYDEKKKNLSRKCLAWENTVVIKSKNREDAFKKICEIGKQGQGKANEMWDAKGRKGQWIFEGLTSLIPIYEDLGDGTEVLWTEYRGKTVRKIKSKIKKKNNLEVFQDN